MCAIKKAGEYASYKMEFSAEEEESAASTALEVLPFRPALPAFLFAAFCVRFELEREMKISRVSRHVARSFSTKWIDSSSFLEIETELLITVELEHYSRVHRNAWNFFVWGRCEIEGVFKWKI